MPEIDLSYFYDILAFIVIATIEIGTLLSIILLCALVINWIFFG